MGVGMTTGPDGYMGSPRVGSGKFRPRKRPGENDPQTNNCNQPPNPGSIARRSGDDYPSHKQKPPTVRPGVWKLHGVAMSYACLIDSINPTNQIIQSN